MDALDVKIGSFVCPKTNSSLSRYMGTTAGGKEISNLRFNLAAPDLDREADRFFKDVSNLVDRNYAYG